MKIFAPLSGIVHDLTEVPDPVISQNMLGPGLAIAPDDEKQVATSPIAGTVTNVRDHAVVFQSGATVLVHVGIDTFSLTEGLRPRVSTGSSVIVGTPVIDVDVPVVAASRNPVTTVTVLGGHKGKFTPVRVSGDRVERGDLLGEYALDEPPPQGG